MKLISPELLFARLLDVERKVTAAGERFGVAVLGDVAREDSKTIHEALDAVARMFAQPSLPLKLRRRKRR